MPRRTWTQADDAKLVDLVKDPTHKLSARDIADTIGRSEASVKHRAARLGYAHVGRAKTARYDDAFIDQMVKWREDGLTHRQIGERLGLNVCNVNSLLASRGKQKKVNHWTEQEDAWIRVNYPHRHVSLDGLPGRSAKAIAHRAGKLGVSRAVGKSKGCAGKKRVFDEPQVCAEYQRLQSLKAVAALYGASETTISRVLKRNSITPKPYSRFDAQRDAIIADYREGKLSMLAMEAKYGFSCDEMREKLKACGVYDPKRKDAFVNRKPAYDCWVESMGQEAADKRWAEYLVSHKRGALRGPDSPSYGKPSPRGTGNGWKGWYRGHYFRSLREVCYMLVMDAAGASWQTGETLSIPYTFRGAQRTYRPDYVIGSRMVEVKPAKLHDSPLVSAKRAAAEAYCQSRGMTYELVDVVINAKAIHAAWTQGLVRFDRDYEARFLDYIATHSG